MHDFGTHSGGFVYDTLRLSRDCVSTRVIKNRRRRSSSVQSICILLSLGQNASCSSKISAHLERRRGRLLVR